MREIFHSTTKYTDWDLSDFTSFTSLILIFSALSLSVYYSIYIILIYLQWIFAEINVMINVVNNVVLCRLRLKCLCFLCDQLTSQPRLTLLTNGSPIIKTFIICFSMILACLSGYLLVFSLIWSFWGTSVRGYELFQRYSDTTRVGKVVWTVQKQDELIANKRLFVNVKLE